MRGLDDALQQYVSSAQLQEVNGERLLKLTHHELLSLGITRVGHQELLLEALDLLCALNCGVECEQMKTLVGKMRQSHQNLSSAVSQRRKNPSYHSKTSNLPPNDFLSAVVELISAAKGLLGWLDRTPVTSANDLTSTKSCIIQLCLELTSTVQKDCTIFEMEEKILEVSKALNSICDQTAQLTSDPSHSDLSCLEEVHIRDVKPGEGLGIYIKSTYDGLHVITGTTENSPADQTQRIHAGDEVVQVNGQTVVGWQLKHLVEKLRAESGGVLLMLKKRPSGNSGGGFTAAPLRNMRWRPPLVKTTQASGLRSRPDLGESPKRGAAILDLYIPPPPAAPYAPLEEGGSSSVKPLSPNSCLDTDDVQTNPGSYDPNLKNPVRLRQQPSTRCKPRPVSLPVESYSAQLSSRLQARKGGALQRCLSNERVAAILEEEECFPVPYRAQPSLRGVDHIRGSRCFINAELHNSATIPYHEATAAKAPPQSPTRPGPGPKAGPPQRNKPSSVIGGWLARLRLLSH